ncbi:MAG: putative membrane protein [Cenarchaeum symbiont of Oopsacas minuta]|nr:putative membrane protein [Cenarchaeum symbiont of Oopsacas minuta]
MAKFKKKKSELTKEPEKIDISSTETPEIAKIPESPKIPKDVPESVVDPTSYRKKLDHLYWLRIILATISGVIATFAFENIEGEERRWASIVFMIIVYMVTILIAKGMKMQLPSSDRKKIVTQAIGSFVFIYLFVWIVTYTLVNMTTGGLDLGLSPLP